MRGYLVSPGDYSGDESDWESIVTNAVGSVIEFWGFKHNHGRVWALLYLRSTPLPASTLQEALGLSKGAVSMITRELEQWDVIHRVRVPNETAWHFVAETDLKRMITRVLKERESKMVARVRSDLERAHALAQDDEEAPEDKKKRLERLHTLATLIESALSTFLETARLDVATAISILSLAKDSR